MNNLLTPSKTGFLKPYSEVTTITPDLAEQLLERNTNNRKVNRANVNFLKNQLLQNKWMLNGESIKIAKDGEILDGQHRLIACSEIEKPMPCVIMYNVDSESKHTMDTGRNRSAVDVLSFSINSKYIGRISASAKFVIDFNNGRFGTASSNKGNGGGSNKGSSADNTDVLDFVNNTKGFIEFVEHSAKLHQHGDKCVNPKLFTGLHWVITQKSGAKDADKFFSALSTGIGLANGNPIYTLRKKLISMKMSKTNVDRLTSSQILWAIVKVWNYWVDGDSIVRMHKYDTAPIEIKIK